MGASRRDASDRLRLGDRGFERGDAGGERFVLLTRLLRHFAHGLEILTRHAYKNTPADVQRVRQAGWTDEQISEAAYVAAIFAFFNRVADAFGLVDPGYDQLQPPAGSCW